MADTHHHSKQVQKVGLRYTPEFLQLFTDLASMDLKTRTTAGTELLKTVIDKQAEFENTESKSGDHCPELQYTVKRLCKGLASSRDGARQGFATVLTEILKTFPSVSTKTALDTIMAENEVKGKEIKGKAPREQLFGRIFGLATLARSKRLESDVAALSKSGVETYMNEVAAVIIGELLRDAKKKEFLGELCFDVVGSTLSQFKKEHYEKYIQPLLLPKISVPSEELSPDALLLIIYMKKTFKFDVTTLGGQWKSSKLISSKNFAALKPALMKAASAFPKFHSVWPHLFEELASRDAPGAFVESMKEIFDECLGAEASKSARYMGLHVMAMLFEKIDGALAAMVLTPKIVDSLAKTATLKKEVSYQAAKRVLSSIAAAGAKSEAAAAALLEALQGQDNSKSFDAKSQTKTVSALLAHVSAEKAHEYLNKAINDFNEVHVKEEELEGETNVEQGKQKIVDIKRSVALDQIYFMLRTPLAFKDEALTSYALKFLFFHAFYVRKEGKSKGTPKKEDEVLSKLSVKLQPELSARMRNSCKERLFSLLDFLYKAAKTSKKSNEGKEKNGDEGDDEPSSEEEVVNGNKTIDGVNLMKSGEFWGDVLVKFQAQLDNSAQFTRKQAIQDDEAKEAYSAGLALLEKIRKMRDQASKGDNNDVKVRRLRAFESLVIFVLLEFNNVPEETADLVPEIEMCLQKIFEASPKKAKKEKTPKKAKKHDHGDEEHDHDEEAGPLEVLTDVLVGMLVKESHLLREIVSQVFVSFIADWSAECIGILLSAVEDPESVIDVEDVNEDDDEEDEAMELDEFQEKFMNKEGNDDEEEDDDDDEDEDEDEDEESSEEKEDVKMKDDKKQDGKKGKKAKEDEEDSDEEMEDLPPADDDEMFKMDEALSKMFAERKELKKKRKDQESQLTHFRIRVLSLLDAYVKKMIHSNTVQSPLVYKLLTPLLTIVKDGLKKKENLKDFLKTCTNIYNRVVKAAKPAEGGNDIEELKTILDSLLNIGLKSNIRHIIDLSRAGVAFIIKVLTHINKSDKKPLGALDLQFARQTFTNAFNVLANKKNTTLTPDFYAPFLYNNPDLGWALADIVAAAVKNSSELKCMQPLVQMLKNKSVADHKDKLKSIVPDWIAGYRTAITKKEKKPSRAEFADMNKCTTSLLRAFVANFDVNTLHKTIGDWKSLVAAIDAAVARPEYDRKQAVLMTAHQLKSMLSEGTITEMPKDANAKKEKKNKKEKGDKTNKDDNNNKNTKKEQGQQQVKKQQNAAPKIQEQYIPQPPKEEAEAPKVSKYDKNKVQKQNNGVAGVKRKQESNGTSDKRPNKKQKK